MRSRGFATVVSFVVGVLVATMWVGASSALAEEAHPFVSSFGRTPSEPFTNPNGIAVEESTGDVYVADIATNTVYRFDASGKPVDFTGLGSNALTGGATPAKSFLFPEASDTPAAIAVDNSKNSSDPSAGDLYVMDADHQVIDKFNASGEYVGQITGPFAYELRGLAVDANGNVRVDVGRTAVPTGIAFEVFDNSVVNILNHTVDERKSNDAASSASEYGFAVGVTGDRFQLFGCGCVEKFGASGYQFGRVDSGPGGVAVAVDPVSGHLYVDDQSSVVEWDTGAMNGDISVKDVIEEDAPSAALVSSFGLGRLSGVAAGQGGIAVDGASGEIYVSNPADGMVYVFGSATPTVAAGAVANLSETGTTLQGTVDPRSVPVGSCVFEYEKGPEHEEEEGGMVPTPVTVFDHSVPCATEHGEPVGAGSSPVAVHADISGLTPGVLYYYRLLVGNANGTSLSEGRFATVGSGFGVTSFGVSFVNQDGTPDTQAGSHPNTAVVNFDFKKRAQPEDPRADSPYVIQADGNVKDVIVDTPPGFVGNPNATEAKCTLRELGDAYREEACPPGSQVGELEVEFSTFGSLKEPIFNMVAPHGVAAQFGANFILPKGFINFGLQTGGDYPLQSESLDISAIEAITAIRLTVFGVVGSGENRKPFLTMPTGCTGPLKSSISVDSYQEPGHFVGMNEVTRDSNGDPLPLTGCSQLEFPPSITVAPDVPDASTPSGLTVGVHVSQKAAFNPDGLGESALRDTTVTLPAGVAINPAGADGLEACSEALAGFTGFEEFNPEFEPGVKWATFTPTSPEQLQPGVSFCPNGSKIGTVKVRSPLLPNPLEGSVYLGAQEANPFGSLVAMYIIVEDPVSGSLVKIAGEVRLCESVGQLINGVSCEAQGQLVATFKNTPDVPFEDLELHFFGGERAPLRTPSRCGTYTTNASFTPWDGNAPVNTSSSFQITSGPNGGPCPGASLPFKPTLNAGTTSNQAGGFSPFTMTMSRKDGEQNLQAIDLHMPPGLSGLLTGLKLCGEAEGNAGTCGPESEIGETTVGVGVGGKPFSVTGGKVFITGPYEGAPFGLSIVNPAKAGPYDLEKGTACDCVVVRAKIEVDPLTASLVITSDNSGPYKIPTILDGIPLEIQHVNVTITRHGFTFNPTNCDPSQIKGSLSSTEGAVSALSVPLQATNCAALAFKPGFKVSTSGKTSRKNGASLSVKLTYPKEALGKDANIKSVKVDLPKQLPSRLTTLQKACTAATFEANPANCPADSRVGHAKALTPLVPVALEGPAYFVSFAGLKFPELVVVLQGYGVTIDLHGETFISKQGVTSSTFRAVPDAPVGSFELTLPEGPFSALAANGNLCKSKLTMPTAFVAQNGATINQTTPIGVTGCKPAVNIVRHSVKGATVTVAASVPSAGVLVASGAGLSRAVVRAGKPGTLTCSLKLSAHDRALLKSHPGRKLKVAVKLVFTPAHGQKLTAGVSVNVG
jgi:DNA-binding beta-propeller fold protein YncE